MSRYKVTIEAVDEEGDVAVGHFSGNYLAACIAYGIVAVQSHVPQSERDCLLADIHQELAEESAVEERHCHACGADVCGHCGHCLTEHNDDPVRNCPKTDGNPKPATHK